MQDSKAISSSDPQALEKLTEKKQTCEQLQATMKAANAHWRKTGTCKGAPGISDAEAARLDARIANAHASWEQVPYPDYKLKNNNAEIKRLEKRIADITRDQDIGYSGWEFDGGRAEANADMCRLQLFFDEKPDEQRRAALKSNGFKWAPSQGAWQRQLNANAIFAAGHIAFIAPTDGRSVRDHQPKAPQRDSVSR